MVDYIAYLLDEKDNVIDQTGINEKSLKLARELFIEFGHDLKNKTIKLELEEK